MALEPTSEAVRGSLAVAGAATSVMSPNELASLVAAVLTAVFVTAQLITLAPKLLDSIAELKRRLRGGDDKTE